LCPHPSNDPLAQNAEQPAAEVTWTGTIARFTFRNQETGFAVLRLTPDGGGALRTAVGVLAQFSEGQRLRLTGKVSEHPKFGRQLEARNVEAEAPKTAEGVIAYLSSGLVKGLGPATARRIVEQLGPEALARIETEPEQLAKVKGLGGKRAEELVAAIQEQRDLHGVLVFLRSHGLGAALAMRVFKRYGRGAAALIQSDPYRLADDVIGVGFKTADQLAQRLGLALDAPARVRAGALFALGEAARDGHCFLPTDALVQATVDLLDVSATLVEPALPDLAQDGRIVLEPVAGGARAYPRTLHLAEVGCARRLRELADASARPLPIGAAEAVEWFVQRSGMALPDGQRRALATALQHSVSVITGGPGVGKTTIVRALVAILREHGLKLRLCAPTGRAAKRLEESTQHAATTIHRLLEFQAGVFRFQRASDHPIEGDMLVVDETSMLDIQLAYALLRAVPPGMRVVFVGDADQLPAVGPGNFLRDLIDSGELR
jgi:exodeoxyribonuclease V alpha subunit